MLIEELLTFHNLKASKPIQLRNKLLASLHYNHGMPKQTLAEKMGLAIQTVKRILKAARPPEDPVEVSLLSDDLEEEVRSRVAKPLIKKMVDEDEHLITIPYLRRQLKIEHDLILSDHHTRQIVKKDLQLVWRRVMKGTPYINCERNLFLRQDCAAEFIPLLEEGSYMMSYDESRFVSTTSRRMSFAPKNKYTMRTFGRNFPPLNLLCCVLSDGDIYYKLSTGTHNRTTQAEFFMDLHERLLTDKPFYPERYTAVLDGSKNHTNPLVREILRKMSIQTVILSPSMPDSVPCEKVFKYVKLKELDWADMPTEM
jgi:hypothetical protein